ncbi:DUF6787 family protein [Aureivirga sp. CE67]|uniref:DUF6787 family protein n=1 Tax=Aureivirga sp. CE67 TaxID=1788983 RepID=UPI0018CA5C6C|nr:DUF6787 family protein [Aureivirga sp. CE67]
MEKLKERWGIKSNLQIILIMCAFAVNGSLAVKLADPVTNFFGLYRGVTNPFIYWPFRILLIFPIYQFTLVFVGACFGQYRFFWNMEKKMLKRIGFKRFFKED